MKPYKGGGAYAENGHEINVEITPQEGLLKCLNLLDMSVYLCVKSVARRTGSDNQMACVQSNLPQLCRSGQEIVCQDAAMPQKN